MDTYTFKAPGGRVYLVDRDRAFVEVQFPKRRFRPLGKVKRDGGLKATQVDPWWMNELAAEILRLANEVEFLHAARDDYFKWAEEFILYLRGEIGGPEVTKRYEWTTTKGNRVAVERNRFEYFIQGEWELLDSASMMTQIREEMLRLAANQKEPLSVPAPGSVKEVESIREVP